MNFSNPLCEQGFLKIKYIVIVLFSLSVGENIIFAKTILSLDDMIKIMENKIKERT